MLGSASAQSVTFTFVQPIKGDLDVIPASSTWAVRNALSVVAGTETAPRVHGVQFAGMNPQGANYGNGDVILGNVKPFAQAPAYIKSPNPATASSLAKLTQAYRQLVLNVLWSNPMANTPLTFTVGNLKSGHLYAVRIWSGYAYPDQPYNASQRLSAKGTHSVVTVPLGLSTKNGLGSYITATFTAGDSPSQEFSLISPGNQGMLTAIEVLEASDPTADTSSLNSSASGATDADAGSSPDTANP